VPSTTCCELLSFSGTTCLACFYVYSNIKCQRKTFLCPQGDAECLYAPLSYSTNFITFPSRIHIPADLFTMRGPLSPYRRLAFDLKLIKAEDPRTGQRRISQSHFAVKQATSSHYLLVYFAANYYNSIRTCCSCQQRLSWRLLVDPNYNNFNKIPHGNQAVVDGGSSTWHQFVSVYQ